MIYFLLQDALQLTLKELKGMLIPVKNAYSPFAKAYLSEVLGIKTYLCPEAIHSFRSLEGGLPCRVLTVVFKALSPPQRILLKKIMASIDVFEFAVLEIKRDEVLNQLLSCEESLADFICFFGGKDLVKEDLLIEREGAFISACKKNSVSKPPVSFLQVCSLEELEGDSIEVRNRKKQLWERLKNWKKISRI